MSAQQKILSESEVTRLLENADSEFDRKLIKTCLYHGLRNEETVSLQRKHVNFDNLGVHIERQNTKSDAGVRFVPTLDRYQSEFRNWVKSQTDHPEDYLFPSPRTDSHITERYFQDMMLDLAWECGFYPRVSSKDMVRKEVPETERVRPHALRHTYGTRMYENGVKPKELSDVMGHKKLEITMNLYAHLATERSRDMLNQAAQQWD